MQSQSSKVVILGTGGTIAGTASTPGDNVGYQVPLTATTTRVLLKPR